jgi:hypothetical protein
VVFVLSSTSRESPQQWAFLQIADAMRNKFIHARRCSKSPMRQGKRPILKGANVDNKLRRTPSDGHNEATCNADIASNGVS